ncbi:hypothetical protein Acsp01_68460 [Actinoplanes sp. NBRC 101535]|nr:hypothetical protein Acsp01_68460 [Actinoplanes sp. NBRC 101535]
MLAGATPMLAAVLMNQPVASGEEIRAPAPVPPVSSPEPATPNGPPRPGSSPPALSPCPSPPSDTEPATGTTTACAHSAALSEQLTAHPHTAVHSIAPGTTTRS